MKKASKKAAAKRPVKAKRAVTAAEPEHPDDFHPAVVMLRLIFNEVEDLNRAASDIVQGKHLTEIEGELEGIKEQLQALTEAVAALAARDS